jgi:hypothetical protein
MDQPTDNTPAEANSVTDTQTQDTAPVADNISPPSTEVTDAKQDSTPISSGAGDTDANKKPTSLLDAVKRAAQKSADAASSTVETNGASAKDASSPTAGLDDTAKDKSKPEADQKLPFHNHPRWKEMVSERDSYRTDADQYRKITSFMQSNGLQQNEVVEGFQIMALMKTSPAEAYKRLKEYTDRLAPFAGEKLPEDIAKRVEEGYIHETDAKRLAVLEAERKLREDRDTYFAQQRDIANRQSIHSTVVNWEQQMKVKDPDWSAKQDLVLDQVRLMLQAEQPSTPDEAIALVERAHSTVRERLSRFAPQRRPVSTLSSASSSASAVPQPKSLFEAVKMGAMASR